jgi:hypothetical protein
MKNNNHRQVGMKNNNHRQVGMKNNNHRQVGMKNNNHRQVGMNNNNHRQVGMKNNNHRQVGMKNNNHRQVGMKKNNNNMKMEQSVPKRQHTKFRGRGITQKKTYNKLQLRQQQQDKQCTYKLILRRFLATSVVEKQQVLHSASVWEA